MHRPQNRLAFALMALEFRVRDLLRPPAQTLAHVGLQPGQTVLDLGCGPGGFSLAAARAVGPTGKVLALDLNPLAVAMVERQARSQGLDNISAVCADNTVALPVQDIDVALVYDVLHDFGDPPVVLADLHRVLKPDGLLSVSDHHLKDGALLVAVTAGDLFRLSRIIQNRVRVFCFTPAPMGKMS